MTLTELQSVLREKVREAAQHKFQITLDQVVAEVPPKTELGDLAFPVGFELAKQIKAATGEKQNPRALAETLKAELIAEAGARVRAAVSVILALRADAETAAA